MRKLARSVQSPQLVQSDKGNHLKVSYLGLAVRVEVSSGVFCFLLCKCVILGHMARSSITTLTVKNHQALARSNKVFILVLS